MAGRLCKNDPLVVASLSRGSKPRVTTQCYTSFHSQQPSFSFSAGPMAASLLSSSPMFVLANHLSGNCLTLSACFAAKIPSFGTKETAGKRHVFFSRHFCLSLSLTHISPDLCASI